MDSTETVLILLRKWRKDRLFEDGTPALRFALASCFRAATSAQPNIENAPARFLLNISVLSQNCMLHSCQGFSSWNSLQDDTKSGKFHRKSREKSIF
ncbi:hypothetical protein Y032_0101g3355 [Ancylostoma ceylanicum]|uniref:Uncharacterized protein n=1 Tax=Ancylostoma ceylanicum TaxID=53326 RepID=A0A016TGV4_9BILA|nr:hypothetical protein Y032_0101g3355 [Ancylostoma ceylanicum]